MRSEEVFVVVEETFRFGSSRCQAKDSGEGGAAGSVGSANLVEFFQRKTGKKRLVERDCFSNTKERSLAQTPFREVVFALYWCKRTSFIGKAFRGFSIVVCLVKEAR